MRYFQILYKTASGVNKLTHTFNAKSAQEAYDHSSDFVKLNYIYCFEIAG